MAFGGEKIEVGAAKPVLELELANGEWEVPKPAFAAWNGEVEEAPWLVPGRWNGEVDDVPKPVFAAWN